MLAQAVAEFEHIDVLVNNAGVQTWAPLLELAEADWDRVIRTNLKGCFLCTQRTARLMKDHGGGKIINPGSGANKIAFSKLVDYTTRPGGGGKFTKIAARGLPPDGIPGKCLAPGAIQNQRKRPE